MVAVLRPACVAAFILHCFVQIIDDDDDDAFG